LWVGAPKEEDLSPDQVRAAPLAGRIAEPPPGANAAAVAVVASLGCGTMKAVERGHLPGFPASFFGH